MRALYGSEPSDEAVDEYWADLQMDFKADFEEGNLDKDKAFLTPDGKLITSEGDYLRKYPNAMTWEAYQELVKGTPPDK